MEILPIPAESFKVGFIGAGKMAESIARGVVASGVLPPNRICTAVHSNLNRRDVFESFGVNVFSTSEELYLSYDVVKKAVTELKSKLSKNKILVSVAAGIKLNDLQEWSGQDRFIRVMPNTHAAVGEAASADEKMFDAVTGLSGSGPAYIFLAIEALADGGVAAGLPRDLALSLASQTVLGAATMVSKTGKHPGVLKDDVTSPGGTTIAGVHELEKGSFRATLMNILKADEKMFDAVTGLSGSGPAYIFLAIEALADGGVAAGLPRELALSLASQTVLGAATMVSKTGKHPGVLKDDVTSPGGTTIAGVHELEKGSFRATLMNAVVAAAKRSRELSQS
ncbi:unnamed protein product [Arabidopsis thaliana]|uniref:(thale cress) hypothetical protein n=1 Tax=Arabidopsis thaliana TaxID=3702 RepID=A0A7G2FFV0_ARATH|nr:unnamed protein product [Arabidopsis thaliana]